MRTQSAVEIFEFLKTRWWRAERKGNRTQFLTVFCQYGSYLCICSMLLFVTVMFVLKQLCILPVHVAQWSKHSGAMCSRA